ncbi:hypothetical protein SI65_00651 [Aspergillus cristatus]|uniref:Bicarbonate transporter-like transmembrane domain-containing protein n=1 Tax=Aspergillus cristatus TaxID=573508 RepID=A0A1E3BQ26_ASPCR|nr:hypothetical protein SI65_00651 [Aspergillus cristatus]
MSPPCVIQISSSYIASCSPDNRFPDYPDTDSLVNFQTELDIVSMAEGEGEGAEIRRHIMKPVSVVEQRVSHFFMGLGIIGTMTGPLLIVLHTMPAAVFAGVFFTVGWGSIGGNGILKKSVFLLLDHRFVARHEPLLKVRQRKITLWIACQMFGVAASLAISFTIAAIGFPVVIGALASVDSS